MIYRLTKNLKSKDAMLNDDLINFDLPTGQPSIIKVFGVGGGGGNAVNHMHKLGIKDVEFVIGNTDAQALAKSAIPTKIQLGDSLTQGRGAGNKPEVGMEAANEALDTIVEVLSTNTKMVFITAGMGGGTGTGAAPVIAKASQDLGILTVGIVTLPFRFEGPKRFNNALEGIREMQNYVDSLLVINNERIREIYGNLQLSESFAKADDVLAIAAKGIAEIITVHGYINVDFADVETVMRGSGVALMGSGRSSGPDRARLAVEMALNSPLLNNCNIQGAKNILYNIQSGQSEITMDELGLIGDYIQNAAGNGADVIWGNGIDPNLSDEISITIIATGFTSSVIPELHSMTPPSVTKVVLPDGNADEQKPEYVVLDMDGADSFDSDSSQEQEELVETAGEFTVRTVQRSSGGAGSRYMQDPKSRELTDRRIEELEKVPAYERRRQSGESSMRSNEQVSRFTISDESSLLIRPDNSYLHDNVD